MSEFIHTVYFFIAASDKAAINAAMPSVDPNAVAGMDGFVVPLTKTEGSQTIDGWYAASRVTALGLAGVKAAAINFPDSKIYVDGEGWSYDTALIDSGYFKIQGEA